ncbi:dynamin family protein [Nannocystis radixulma]|uniref:dynamin family protein n=1 Tax=Nannocystis radixulma TaxID=2995305 RepID=UPI00232F9117|nr:dynamin family protein [Nannocystis radixulma]
MLEASLQPEDANPALQDLAKKLEGTQRKWRERTFQVAVLALVKSGKSTLINALLGQEFLPAANTPETARLVRIAHSPGEIDGALCEQNVVLARGAGSINQYIQGLNRQARENDELPEEDLTLAAPLHSLSTHSLGADRFEILDTPGPNEAETSALKARVEVLLDEVDVIVYVLDYTKLKTAEEKHLLQTLAQMRPELLRSCAERLFFVVNKLDAQNRNGLTRAETATYVSDLLQRQLPGIQVAPDRILLISAEQALLARVLETDSPSPKAQEDFAQKVFGLAHDDKSLDDCRQRTQWLLTKSGIPDLEARMIAFIFDHRAALLLQGILDDLGRFLTVLDNYLYTAEAAVRARSDELRQKATALRKDLASTLAGLQEIKIASERVKRESEEWIRERFDAFRQKTHAKIALTLDPKADAGFVHRLLSRALSRAREYLFGHDASAEIAQIRVAVVQVNQLIEQFIRREFGILQQELEAEALEKQRLLFASLQDTIQPIARRIEGHINRSFSISLDPVLVQLPAPTLGSLHQKIATHAGSLIATTRQTVPVMKTERYVVRRGLCSSDYATREVIRQETITTHEIARDLLQDLWSRHISELTEQSIKTTNLIIGKVIVDAIEQARQELSRYANGFLSTIESEIRQSEKGRVLREHRLQEIVGRRATLGTLQEHIRSLLQHSNSSVAENVHRRGAVPQNATMATTSNIPLEELKGKIDFAIMTIREDEFEAVLDRFPANGKAIGQRHYNICRANLANGEHYLVAVIRCIEPSNDEAQDAARDVLEDLAPQWFFVVGIAGGVPSVEFGLGDVVVSTRLHDFRIEAVLQDKEREYALGGGPMHKDAATLAANLRAMKGELDLWNSADSIGVPRPQIDMSESALYGEAGWRDKVRSSILEHASRVEPLVTAGAIASSDRLIKDADLLAVWLKIARQVLAVEMELAGVFRATHGRLPMLAIRGISDIVGFHRDPRWTTYACHTAAAFTHALVRSRPIVPQNLKGRSTSS